MPKIRKSCTALMPADFAEHPAWEFALDEEGVPGQDETTVRPVPGTAPYSYKGGDIIVAAKFRLNDGRVLDGAVAFGPSREVSSMQPVIMTGKGQVLFWHGIMAPDRKEMDQAYAKLGGNANSVFPIQFESVPKLDEDPLVGSIPGFLSMKSFTDDSTVEHR